MSDSAQITLTPGIEDREQLLAEIEAIRKWDNGKDFPIKVFATDREGFVMDSIKNVEDAIKEKYTSFYIETQFSKSKKIKPQTEIPEGPLTDPAENIEGTILATTPKIIIVGTGPTAIRNAMNEIEKYYNGKSPMKVILVDNKLEPIAESNIEQMRKYDEEGKLQPFIKNIGKSYIEEGKGRLFGGMGKSDSQKKYSFAKAKKKRDQQKKSRKANRRRK